MGSPQLHFDDCELDAAAFELRRAGRVCDVEPQVFELLLYLARHPDQLITKNDLIREIWGGRIVSDSTLASRIKSARRAIGDDGEQQRRIKTVHGRGVRFVGEGVGGVEKKAAARPAWPSIAVLPFANVSDEPEQNYFADGLTEDIITDLSRFRELRVVARDSSFRFRETGGDLQKIGRELNADYLVTGSIRRRGVKLRLSAQLIDIRDGTQAWAERFDRGVEDVFEVADQLVRTIVGTLVGRVRQVGSTLARRKQPANLAAYECVLRGQQAQGHMGDPVQEAEARRFFELALAADPYYPRAHAGLAVVLLSEWFRAPEEAQAILDRALAHAETAVAIDGDDYECQETLGWILLHRKSYDLSEQHYRRAIELNPNSPAELAAMGCACTMFGRPADGLRWFELAKQIDPYFDANWYWNLLGVCYFTARRYDEAVAAFNHCPITPLWVTAYVAASHALAGRLEAAREAAAKLRNDPRQFSVAVMVRKEPFKNPADLAHLMDGLTRAGLLTDSRGFGHQSRKM